MDSLVAYIYTEYHTLRNQKTTYCIYRTLYIVYTKIRIIYTEHYIFCTQQIRNYVQFSCPKYCTPNNSPNICVTWALRTFCILRKIGLIRTIITIFPLPISGHINMSKIIYNNNKTFTTGGKNKRILNNHLIYKEIKRDILLITAKNTKHSMTTYHS